MKTAKLNFLKQILLCIWIAITIYVWIVARHVDSEVWKLVPIFTQYNIKVQKLIWPYVYYPGPSEERKSK